MQAANFGVTLREHILDEHDIQIDRKVHWTDSTTFQKVLHLSDKKQPIHVTNRVAEDLEQSTIEQRRLVKGKGIPLPLKLEN